MNFLRRLSDNSSPSSWAHRFRQRRFPYFLQLLKSVKPPFKILDIGGTQTFWQMMNFDPPEASEVHLLNIYPLEVSLPGFFSHIGDGRNLSYYSDKSFDIVFSNSVIEHVGSFAEQQLLASEIIRVGKSYFVQTPNKFFPIEPHYHLPFFQFLPLPIKSWLHQKFELGWAEKANSPQAATIQAQSVNLLTKKQLKQLFPEATIIEEKFLGLTKSFIVIRNSA